MEFLDFCPSHNIQISSTQKHIIKHEFLVMKIFTVKNIFLTVPFLATAVSSAKISLGSFRSRDHDVAGEVFLKSERVLEIQNFVYDGSGTSNLNVVTKHYNTEP